MAKPDREPAQAQTHGGPLQDHRGGAEAKEGNHTLNSFLIPWPYFELTTRPSLSYQHKLSFPVFSFLKDNFGIIITQVHYVGL